MEKKDCYVMFEAAMGGAHFWHGGSLQSFADCLKEVRMYRNRGTSWFIKRGGVVLARSVFGSNLTGSAAS